MINAIDQVSFSGQLHASENVGTQPLRPHFQGNKNLSSTLLSGAKEAFSKGVSPLPAKALGEHNAINGALGAKLNVIA